MAVLVDRLGECLEENMAGVPIDVIERARDLLIGFEAEASAPAKPRRKATQQDQLSLFE